MTGRIDGSPLYLPQPFYRTNISLATARLGKKTGPLRITRPGFFLIGCATRRHGLYGFAMGVEKGRAHTHTVYSKKKNKTSYWNTEINFGLKRHTQKKELAEWAQNVPTNEHRSGSFFSLSFYSCYFQFYVPHVQYRCRKNFLLLRATRLPFSSVQRTG